MSGTVLEGVVDLVRHGDGRIEIRSAPPTVRFSLDFFAAADPAVVRVGGNRIALADQVVYRVTGWDGNGQALLAELVEDRRLAR